MRKTSKSKFPGRAAVAALMFCAALPAATLHAAHGAGPAPAGVLNPITDMVTVATVTTAVRTVDVPVYIRDTSGSPLGVDQPAGSRIQSFSITVNYPAGAGIQSISFDRAGITTPLTPTFEQKPTSASAVSLLDTFQESTNLIPFTSNGALPGNLIGHLTVTLAPTVPVGTTIPLTLDVALTQLTDEGGTAATKETVANGRLTLVAGAIVFTGIVDVPTLSQYGLLLLVATLAFIGLRTR